MFRKLAHGMALVAALLLALGNAAGRFDAATAGDAVAMTMAADCDTCPDGIDGTAGSLCAFSCAVTFALVPDTAADAVAVAASGLDMRAAPVRGLGAPPEPDPPRPTA